MSSSARLKSERELFYFELFKVMLHITVHWELPVALVRQRVYFFCPAFYPYVLVLLRSLNSGRFILPQGCHWILLGNWRKESNRFVSNQSCWTIFWELFLNVCFQSLVGNIWNTVFLKKIIKKIGYSKEIW